MYPVQQFYKASFCCLGLTSSVNVIPNNTAGMIEMDIGIIAASLVVMRPAFQFLHQKFTGRVANIKGLSASGEASRYVTYAFRGAKKVKTHREYH